MRPVCPLAQLAPRSEPGIFRPQQFPGPGRPGVAANFLPQPQTCIKSELIISAPQLPQRHRVGAHILGLERRVLPKLRRAGGLGLWEERSSRLPPSAGTTPRPWQWAPSPTPRSCCICWGSARLFTKLAPHTNSGEPATTKGRVSKGLTEDSGLWRPLLPGHPTPHLIPCPAGLPSSPTTHLIPVPSHPSVLPADRFSGGTKLERPVSFPSSLQVTEGAGRGRVCGSPEDALQPGRPAPVPRPSRGMRCPGLRSAGDQPQTYKAPTGGDFPPCHREVSCSALQPESTCEITTYFTKIKPTGGKILALLAPGSMRRWQRRPQAGGRRSWGPADTTSFQSTPGPWRTRVTKQTKHE